MTLKEILKTASKEGWSTGHFNVSELDQMRAIVEACKEAGSPAIIGTSEGEAEHFGYSEAVALRDVMKKEYGVPVFLNADHHKSFDAAKKAIDAGYDSVHIDLSKLPFEENVAGTKSVCGYARAKNPDISVEGEVGYIVTDGSRVYNKKFTVPLESLTKPEEAKLFIEKTLVERLAIAVGNIHGISLEEPDLDIDRIKAIRLAIPEDTVLVLHAGSGIPENQIKASIEAGIANIHINTELRSAFVNALKKTLKDEVDEIAMYKLDRGAIEAMKELVKEKLKLFGSINRI